MCVCVQVHTMKILKVVRAFAAHSADFSKLMIDSLLANALGNNSLKMPDVLLDA